MRANRFAYPLAAIFTLAPMIASAQPMFQGPNFRGRPPLPSAELQAEVSHGQPPRYANQTASQGPFDDGVAGSARESTAAAAPMAPGNNPPLIR